MKRVVVNQNRFTKSKSAEFGINLQSKYHQMREFQIAVPIPEHTCEGAVSVRYKSPSHPRPSVLA